MKTIHNKLDKDNEARPLVTFALFAYNQEKYIREAVEGAFSQAYGPLEIILSDDCSTDQTFNIIQGLASSYSGPHKIIVNRNQKNIGLAKHVNKVGLELAKGKWFVTAAGDDISLSDRVEKIWAAIVKNPKARGVHCAVDRVNEDGVSLNVILPRKIDISNIHRESMLGAAAAYHRDVFELYGPMDGNVQNEDMILSLRSLMMGEIVSFDDVCVLWRRHSNNISSKISSPLSEQLKFLYCHYNREKVYSNIQQFRDALASDEKYQGRGSKLIELQCRLMKRIKFDLLLSQFSNYFFYKKNVPISIKLNPVLWCFLLYRLSKAYVSYYFRVYIASGKWLSPKR